MAHYDLAAAEKSMRDDLLLAQLESNALLKERPQDADFLRAMRGFDEARIQFALASLRLENEGVPRNENLSAAGQAIGSMFASLVLSCVGERERDIVRGWMTNSFAQTMGDGNAEHGTETKIFETPAGHG